MVGFLRKKKSDKTLLSYETALDRKGKIDGASLLDGNGDPASGSLYDARNPHARRNSNQENSAFDNAAVNSNTFPPPYPQQQTYGGAFPTQQHNNSSNGYPAAPPAMQTGFGNNAGGNDGYPRQYGAHQQQQSAPQQYPVRYGAHQTQQSYSSSQQSSSYGIPQQPQYGGPQQQSQYGGPQQPQQYPIQYGHYPPPMQPEAPKKSSGFFRIPGISKRS